MSSPIEQPMADDDLARQRRKREARLLDRPVPDFPGVTLADVVADVVAASDGGRVPLDVNGYLGAQGHGWQTIEAVIGYLHRHYRPDSPTMQQLPLP